MVHEQTKATRRRLRDPNSFVWLSGNGIDIGSGDDALSKYGALFPFVDSIRDWDVGDGDAQHMKNAPLGTFDFVHSSHCLEHLDNPRVALYSWLRLLKPGGHLIVTVPDEDMYERGNWPSIRNIYHLHTFTVWKPSSWSPVSINLVDLLKIPNASIERLAVIRELFDPDSKDDQTLGFAECSIEFILRKLE